MSSNRDMRCWGWWRATGLCIDSANNSKTCMLMAHSLSQQLVKKQESVMLVLTGKLLNAQDM